MAIALLHQQLPIASAESGPSEASFWRLAGASWRQLAGGVEEAGFSFQWQEWAASGPLPWDRSFHPQSVEICLNLEGSGWVTAEGVRWDLGPEMAGFFVLNGGRLAAGRNSGRHQFLSVEFGLPFLREWLSGHRGQLHPAVRRGLEGTKSFAAFAGAGPLLQRHRELLHSLLRPPVLAAAQRLWFEAKALEFATEFFFAAGEGETLCSRSQRLAAERVARAKSILKTNLSAPPSLEELGRQVACSPCYLSRTFTRESGLTISQWVRQARLERAAELLRAGKCNVTEAALEVGYSSLSHFSQAFHEHFGCCPGLYPLRTPTQQQGAE